MHVMFYIPVLLVQALAEYSCKNKASSWVSDRPRPQNTLI